MAKVTPLGWRLGLLAIVVGLAASFFMFGYALIYWRNADMDFMVVYNALVMNDGKPQYFFDHTGYLTILLVKVWFEALHGLGLLNHHALSTMPTASDRLAFDAAMTEAVRAGRLLVWLIGTVSVLIFAALVRAIVRDWRLALVATFAFGFSGSVAVHLRIMRTELIAACPVIFALMIMIVIGRRASPARPLWMAIVAALCVLGLENKVQAILLIAALPLLILPFGGIESASVPVWRDSRTAIMLAAVSAIAAGCALWAAWPLLGIGFDPTLLRAAEFPPLLGRFGAYQIALLLLVCTCMAIYAVRWRVSATETLASMTAVVAGASIALLALTLDYNPGNVIAVFNPLEKMVRFTYVGPPIGSAAGVHPSSLIDILRPLLGGIVSVVARYTFVLSPSPRPTVFLTWLVLPGIAYAWMRSEKQAAIEALFLVMAAIGIDVIGVLRGLKSEYFIFTDPLIILAGTLLLERMPDLRFRKWATPIAVSLFTIQIVVSQAEPVKSTFQRRGPESTCEWNRFYLPLMPLPWCPVPS